MNATVNNKKKKVLTAVLVSVLVVAVAIGGTLAYLFAKTETKENVFTFADNIRGKLDEPSWDPDEGKDLVPGKEVPKDPMITNTSVNGVTEYAAIKLTFVNGAGTTLSDADTATLLSLVDIDWSNTWTLIDGTATAAEQIYAYNDTLPQGVTSDPIFYSLTIKDTVTPEQLLWLAGDYGHDLTCYEFDVHDAAKCTITYRHHERCEIAAQPDKAAVVAGGTAANGDVCDCTASVIHEGTCPSLVGNIKADCGHTTIISGLGNFTIVVEGAVVQADSFDGPFGTDTTKTYAADALIDLFV